MWDFPDPGTPETYNDPDVPVPILPAKKALTARNSSPRTFGAPSALHSGEADMWSAFFTALHTSGSRGSNQLGSSQEVGPEAVEGAGLLAATAVSASAAAVVVASASASRNRLVGFIGARTGLTNLESLEKQRSWPWGFLEEKWRTVLGESRGGSPTSSCRQRGRAGAASGVEGAGSRLLARLFGDPLLITFFRFRLRSLWGFFWGGGATSRDACFATMAAF